MSKVLNVINAFFSLSLSFPSALSLILLGALTKNKLHVRSQIIFALSTTERGPHFFLCLHAIQAKLSGRVQRHGERVKPNY